MGWLIALGVVILLALLPLGGSVVYGSSGVSVKVLAGPVKIGVLPQKKKKPKEEKPSKAEKTEKKKSSKPKKEEKKSEKAGPGGSLSDFMPLIDLGIRFLGDFRRKLRVDRLWLEMTMAGDDPCDLAVNYGRTCGAVDALLPVLERWFVIRRRKIHVGCDFTADETLIWLRLDITITLGRLVWLAFRYGVPAVIQYLKISKPEKGGAVE